MNTLTPQSRLTVTHHMAPSACLVGSFLVYSSSSVVQLHLAAIYLSSLYFYILAASIHSSIDPFPAVAIIFIKSSSHPRPSSYLSIRNAGCLCQAEQVASCFPTIDAKIKCRRSGNHLREPRSVISRVAEKRRARGVVDSPGLTLSSGPLKTSVAGV